MKSVLDTLFYPVLEGFIPKIEADAQILFINAQYHQALSLFDFKSINCQQVFKPYADHLIEKGLDTEIKDEASGFYDYAFVLGSKNQRENENMLGKALTALKDGGIVIMAADNKAGATRLKKMFEKTGLSEIYEQSKNKARVVWAKKLESVDNVIIESWCTLDTVQDGPEGFKTRLGIYGWEKIDAGSRLLGECLPHDLKGKGADFGCGYGYLSKAVLEKNRKIKALDFLDADVRALPLCEANIAEFNIQKTAGWVDLTAGNEALNNKYDWIVMNPPFHEGKKSDHDIGRAFIMNAAKALKKKGQLWMVANRHLPYEAVLESHFWSFDMIKDAKGFKVFKAVK